MTGRRTCWWTPDGIVTGNAATAMWEASRDRTCHHPGCTQPVGRGRQMFCGPEHALARRRAKNTSYAEQDRRNRGIPPRDRDLDIDEVAVALAIAGQTVPLNRAERHAVVAALTAQGEKAKRIAEIVGCSVKTIEFDRKRLGISPRKVT